MLSESRAQEEVRDGAIQQLRAIAVEFEMALLRRGGRSFPTW